MRTPPWRSPYALVLLAAALWALLGVWATELLDAGLAPVEIGFWRAAIGGACFVVHAAVGRHRPARRELPVQAALGVVGVALFYVALATAIENGGVGLSWVLLYTAPAFVLVVGWCTGVAVRLRPVVLLAVTLAGIALVAGSGGGGRVAAGVAWGLLSGATYATHYLVQRTGRAGDEVARYAVAMVVGALVLLPFVDWAGKDGRTWLLLLAIGTVSTYAPFLALSRALQRADPARASLVASVEPVLATSLAVVVYDESLRPLRIVGGALVLAAAALSAYEGDRDGRR